MQTERTQEFHVRKRLSRKSSRHELRHAKSRGAVWQARLIMLVMINIAQLWILAAAVDAALAHHFSVLLPLVLSSGVCFLITLSIIRWWRPTSGRRTSTGYIRAPNGTESDGSSS
ncbi:MAG TPA: hypothetical protein VJS64_08550 [Pyrinomonadaceae bacterium]|nr:hypothetical protein [Pyrinomonadaceae bacterium]